MVTALLEPAVPTINQRESVVQPAESSLPRRTPRKAGRDPGSMAGSPGTLIDVLAVAEMLNCSTSHVWRLRDSGRMPAPIKLGALVRWRLSDIEEWIAAGCPSRRKLRSR